MHNVIKMFTRTGKSYNYWQPLGLNLPTFPGSLNSQGYLASNR